MDRGGIMVSGLVFNIVRGDDGKVILYLCFFNYLVVRCLLCVFKIRFGCYGGEKRSGWWFGLLWYENSVLEM